MLEEELYNDYKAVYKKYTATGKKSLIKEYTNLLIKHAALKDKDYIEKIQMAIELEDHVAELNNIQNKYTNDRSEN